MHVSSSSYDMHRCRAHYQSSRCILLLIWHACILLLIWHAQMPSALSELKMFADACILLLIWHMACMYPPPHTTHDRRRAHYQSSRCLPKPYLQPSSCQPTPQTSRKHGILILARICPKICRPCPRSYLCEKRPTKPTKECVQEYVGHVQGLTCEKRPVKRVAP